MPSKKKKYNARFPPARIKKIMQTDDEVGKVAAAVPVIISRALERFVESLLMKTNDITQSRNAKTLTTLHLKQCILAENKFDFLRDLVASVPDVQVEDETSNSSLNAAVFRNSNVVAVEATKTSAKPPKIQRIKRTRKENVAANSAGPSNSVDEDSDNDEEDDADDDDDDDDDDNNGETEESGTHLSHNLVSMPPTVDPTVNRLAPVNAVNSDDEDYDS